MATLRLQRSMTLSAQRHYIQVVIWCVSVVVVILLGICIAHYTSEVSYASEKATTNSVIDCPAGFEPIGVCLDLNAPTCLERVAGIIPALPRDAFSTAFVSLTNCDALVGFPVRFAFSFISTIGPPCNSLHVFNERRVGASSLLDDLTWPSSGKALSHVRFFAFLTLSGVTIVCGPIPMEIQDRLSRSACGAVFSHVSYYSMGVLPWQP